MAKQETMACLIYGIRVKLSELGCHTYDQMYDKYYDKFSIETFGNTYKPSDEYILSDNIMYCAYLGEAMEFDSTSLKSDEHSDKCNELREAVKQYLPEFQDRLKWNLVVRID